MYVCTYFLLHKYIHTHISQWRVMPDHSSAEVRRFEGFLFSLTLRPVEPR